jgi:hypothetical protein
MRGNERALEITMDNGKYELRLAVRKDGSLFWPAL